GAGEPADRIEAHERAALGDRLVRLRPRVVPDVGEVPDTEASHVHALRREDTELIQGAFRTALVRGMAEDRQPRAEMELADGVKYFDLLRVHLHRSADFS